ncbi:MAG: dTDP-4-dehydrorhamnose 3,5-epimerase [Candidatus Dechloromonas phosphoritropha]|jgi:dTDP-4-dehydrorhamnose 3,5-epimerase|nr:dTDP-4-dehydrorhamnose 3,5-epimerase [Candidatus Dechloromonas phosphoritropha]MBP8787882.1 dTDP-4-dehydrorhamnose 3,5-epimerase [Azonexus sp.]
MNVIQTGITGLLILEPRVFGDDRGIFFESFNRNIFREATGVDAEFVQDNQSRSEKNVLRGLHYQVSPRAQGKLVRVVQGAVFDVAVDIRKDSPTFGQWVGETLSAENKKQVWIPPGFAHGFLTLTDSAEFLYKTTDYYSPDHERCIAWDDPKIGINWPLTATAFIISEKDRRALPLSH